MTSACAPRRHRDRGRKICGSAVHGVRLQGVRSPVLDRKLQHQAEHIRHKNLPAYRRSLCIAFLAPHSEGLVDDLDSRLRNSLGSWLNVDVIDWQCPQLVDEAVDRVLRGLYPLSNSERAALKRTMIQMLSEREPTVDWLD